MKRWILPALLIVLSSAFFSQAVRAQELQYEFLFELKANLDTPIKLGQTAMGNRIIYPVTGGTFEGPKMKGKVLDNGAEWRISFDSTTAKLDVRILLEAEDGSLIYTTYSGFSHYTKDGNRYFRTVPIFETSSKKYSWLNHTIAVGIGRRTDTGVAYKIFAIK